MSFKEILFNKKALYEYHIEEKLETGIVLLGSEVKSIRLGQCDLKNSYISFRGNEAFLQSAYIAPYTASTAPDYQPERLRKLLLHRKEIDRIQGIIQEKKITCIPLRVYIKKGKIKLEIALAKGKAQRDKRESIKKRMADRQIERGLKRDR